jgi:hypothetical protein
MTHGKVAISFMFCFLNDGEILPIENNNIVGRKEEKLFIHIFLNCVRDIYTVISSGKNNVQE